LGGLKILDFTRQSEMPLFLLLQGMKAFLISRDRVG
jgi:hypothetical protein